jgi:excisionase family DNA binding protein
MTATPIPLFDDLDTPAAPPTRRSRRTTTDAQAGPRSEPDHLLTAVEAAAVLGIGRSKLYELVARGAVQSVKLDRCRRFRRSDLDRYISSLPIAPA